MSTLFTGFGLFGIFQFLNLLMQWGIIGKLIGKKIGKKIGKEIGQIIGKKIGQIIGKVIGKPPLLFCSDPEFPGLNIKNFQGRKISGFASHRQKTHHRGLWPDPAGRLYFYRYMRHELPKCRPPDLNSYLNIQIKKIVNYFEI